MMPMCDWTQMAKQALCDELGGVEFYTRMAQCAPTEAETRAVLEIARDELRHALFASNILELGCEVPANPTNGMPLMGPIADPGITPIMPITPIAPIAPITPMPDPMPMPMPCPGMTPMPVQPIPIMSPWGAFGTPMPLIAPAPVTDPATPWGGTCPPWYAPLTPTPFGMPFSAPNAGPMPRVPDFPEPPPAPPVASPGRPCPSCSTES